jgi:hypothetical protein
MILNSRHGATFDQAAEMRFGADTPAVELILV